MSQLQKRTPSEIPKSGETESKKEVKEKEVFKRRLGWKLWTSTDPFSLAVMQHIMHSRLYGYRKHFNSTT